MGLTTCVASHSMRQRFLHAASEASRKLRWNTRCLDQAKIHGKPQNHAAFVKNRTLLDFEYMRAASAIPWTVRWNAQTFVARKSRQHA